MEQIDALNEKRQELKKQNTQIDLSLAQLREVVKSGDKTSQQVAYERKQLIKNKAVIQKDLASIGEAIRSKNRISSLANCGFKTEYLACRHLLREAMKLLNEFRVNGFDKEKSLDLCNEVTAFLMEIPE